MPKLLVFSYLAILAFLSLNPWIKPSGAVAFADLAWDKLEHALAYGGLTVLLVVLFGRSLRGWVPVLLAVLAATAIGVFTEYCQAWFTTDRMFSRFDAYANGIGALAGALGLVSVRWFAGAIRVSTGRFRA